MNIIKIYSFVTFFFINFYPVLAMESNNAYSVYIEEQDQNVKKELEKMRKKEHNKNATELHAAVRLGYTDWVRRWIELNMNSKDFQIKLKAKDSNAKTPKMLAIEGSRLDIIQLLADKEK